jgi:predicted nicotinamide N-methyase
LSETFIAAHTVPARAPLVPEIVLYLATEITPIWLATEAFLERHNLEPPYWAFAWPGSQAMARYVLDNPASVRGRRVLDFAAGGGLAAIACAMAGAASVEAVEIDPVASTATRMNAKMNGVTLMVTTADFVDVKCEWDIILCGDVCYEAAMVGHIVPWLRRMAAGAEVWIADPGRAYLPGGLEAFARYDVPTTKELEDTVMRQTTLHRLLAV